MDVEALISIQLELVVIRDATRPNISIALEDIRVDVKVEVVDVIETIVMEK
jgi:hypothetical protein